MARIRLLDVNQVDPQIRGTLDGIQKRVGYVPNIYRAMANHPGVFEMTMTMNKTIQAGPLDPKIRELAYLKASVANGCEYCLHYHKKAGMAIGLNQSQISDLNNYEKSSAYDDRQKMVLKFTEQLTLSANVEPAVVDALRKVFSDQELVHLAATIGVANWTNRFNHAFDIELEHPGRP